MRRRAHATSGRPRGGYLLVSAALLAASTSSTVLAAGPTPSPTVSSDDESANGPPPPESTAEPDSSVDQIPAREDTKVDDASDAVGAPETSATRPEDADDDDGISEDDDETEAESSSPAQAGPAASATTSDAAGPGLFEAAVEGADAADPAPTETGTTSSSARPRWSFDLSGYVRSDVFVGKAPERESAELKSGYAELSTRLVVARESYGNAVSELRVRAGYDGEQIRLTPDLREAYVNGYFGPVDVRLGHQIVAWGRADIVNPTNNITPHDLRIRSPIEDDRRVANLGLRTFVNLRPVRMEGIWMPLYAATRLPPIVLDDIVTREPDDFPDTNLANGLGAGRFHLELPQFEMSASYVFGHAPLPGWSLVGFDIGEDAAVRVARKPYRHHVAGFDFSTAIGDVIGIRGEVAYRHPLGYAQRVHAPRPDLQYVLGLDRELGPVNVIGQYMGRYTVNWASDEPQDSLDPSILENLEPTDLDSPLVVAQVDDALTAELAWNNQILFSQLRRVQHLASLRVEWKLLHETLSLSALGLVNFSTWEYLINPKVAYRITDRMHVAAGGEVYVGPTNTLFGWIDETLSAGYLELRFSF